MGLPRAAFTLQPFEMFQDKARGEPGGSRELADVHGEVCALFVVEAGHAWRTQQKGLWGRGCAACKRIDEHSGGSEVLHPRSTAVDAAWRGSSSSILAQRTLALACTPSQHARPAAWACLSLQATREVEALVFQMTSALAQLKRLVDLLGGPRDTQEHRHRIADTNTRIQDTGARAGGWGGGAGCPDGGQ